MVLLIKEEPRGQGVARRVLSTVHDMTNGVWSTIPLSSSVCLENRLVTDLISWKYLVFSCTWQRAEVLAWELRLAMQPWSMYGVEEVNRYMALAENSAWGDAWR